MATMRQRRHLPRVENDCGDPSKPSRLMLNWSIRSSQNGASGLKVESPFPTTRFGLKECARIGAGDSSRVEEDLAAVSLPSEIHSLSAPRLSSLTRRNGLSFDKRSGSGGPAAAAPRRSKCAWRADPFGRRWSSTGPGPAASRRGIEACVVVDLVDESLVKAEEDDEAGFKNAVNHASAAAETPIEATELPHKLVICGCDGGDDRVVFAPESELSSSESGGVGGKSDSVESAPAVVEAAWQKLSSDSSTSGSLNAGIPFASTTNSPRSRSIRGRMSAIRG
jgi:hypothetical protein